jgi:16S rRNA (adenine1518-N6/adenine1519-N6)-dimethyltransferase
VYSGLVRIDRYESSPWPTDAEFRNHVFDLIDVAFAQRRKTSRNAFAEWAGSGNESARRLLAASIDPSRRGETLSIADFVRLLQRSGEWEQPTGSRHPEPQPSEESDISTTL